MSGHSKFANIKHKKEKNDAAKGKIFTIIGREIAVAVKEGGGPDPNNNFRLATVIAKAKGAKAAYAALLEYIDKTGEDLSDQIVFIAQTNRMAQAEKDVPVTMNLVGNLIGDIHFPTALCAELFWSADEPYETIVDRVLRRARG